MKKISMLFATAILLYGAPNVYAETEIHPGMSVDEIKAVLEEHGISLAPPDSTTDITDIPEDATTSSTNVDQSQALPPYVSVDNSNLVHTTGPCSPPPSPSFSVTGADMGSIMGTFQVTAVTAPLSLPANWVALPLQAGVAFFGSGWMLFEQGDTWNNNWWIITNTGVTVYSIEIDAWNKNPNLNNNNKHAVFDIINGSEVTPGSANGRPFTKVPPGWPTGTSAVYSTPVLPAGSGNIVPPGHDLYGTLTINFPPLGFSGAAPLGGWLMFKADTDCMPVQEVLLNSYDGTTLNFTVVGEGAVVIAEEDGSVVQGPFVVERGDGSADFVTQFTPKAKSCYVMTDIDTGTVMTDKYCF